MTPQFITQLIMKHFIPSNTYEFGEACQVSAHLDLYELANISR